MLGFYHPPAVANAHAPAVLLCNPFGPEAIRSYRMLRLLADRLAANGCAVLRFDYFGTGDSPGEDDSASLAAWAGDIGVAHRELVARSAKSSVAWVGLRLGASLCAMAAQAARSHLQLVVLWDPVIDGEAYLEVFRSAQSAGRATPLFETMGFEFPERFRHELATFNLTTVGAMSAPRLAVYVGAEGAIERRLHASLERPGVALEWTMSAAVAEWNSEKALNGAVIPMQLLQLVQTKVMEAK